MVELKYIFEFGFPYWKDKSLDIILFWRYGNKYKKELVLSIWKNRRLTDISGYEDEWGTRSWKHIALWKRR